MKKEYGNLMIILKLVLLFTFSLNTLLMAQAGDTKRTRYLLLDSRIIESKSNVKLETGTVTKHDMNPLFEETEPWEIRYDNLYGNVIYDKEEKIYKCWYSPFIMDHSAKGMSLEERNTIPYGEGAKLIREMGICYATSKDGLNWEKPNLGLVEYNGSKDNNIVWRGSQDKDNPNEGPHGSGIFKDDRDPDPNRRYKAILKGEYISVAFSADGLHWSDPVASPEADVAGDTHNNAFWAPTLGKYVGITRSWGKEKGRQVMRTESSDFLKWTEAKLVMEGLDRNFQTYAMPVFYHGGIYIGLVAIHDQTADRVWTELTWSPDTKEWNRVNPGTPLIPCSDKVLDYDYGCVYPCAYPVFQNDKILLYYGGSDYLHFGWRNGSLCLATLRPDGFAGYAPENENQIGTITTKPLLYSGQDLKLSADVKTGGSVKVTVLDNKGEKIAVAQDISKTVTDEPLELDKKLKKGKISLKFEFSKSTIYSFCSK